MGLVRQFVVCATLVFLTATLSAQQPFSFVLTTSEPATTTVPLLYPVFHFAGRDLTPLVGAQSRVRQTTFIATEDTRFDREDARYASQAEILVDVLSPAHDLQIALGSGMRQEGGVDIALGRVVAAKSLLGGRMVGNVLFERPLAQGHDAVDVTTTVGWSRPLTREVALGAETVAKDLEGLWEANEADGGARLFLGPYVDLTSPAHNWSLHLTAGADLRASSSQSSSDPRALRGSGFLMRMSAIHGF